MNHCIPPKTVAYYRTDPSTIVTVTPPSLPTKVSLSVDLHRKHDQGLYRDEKSGHLLCLQSKGKEILYCIRKINQMTTRIELDAFEHFNLFGCTNDSDPNVTISTIESKPVYADKVNISLIHSGNLSETDFKKHLKLYFKSPRILHTGHVFSIRIPEFVPDNVPLETWLEHTETSKIVMPTYPVHFKVTEAEIEGVAMHGFFLISSDKSTVYEVASTHTRIPRHLPNKTSFSFYSEDISMIIKLMEHEQFTPLFLTGLKGSCKEDLVHCIAGYLGLGIYHIRAVEYCGEAPSALENKFKHLGDQLQKSFPCLVYLDHLELLGRTRDGSASDSRVVNAIRNLFETVREMWGEGKEVFVIGSSTEMKTVAMPIRQMFDTCYVLEKPSSQKLFSFLQDSVRLEDNEGARRKIFRYLSLMTLRQTLKFLDCLNTKLGSGMNDSQVVTFDQCLEVFVSLRIEDSSKKGVADTKWEDIGGIDHVRQEIEETIEIPLEHSELFGRGITRSGLLLYGSPGCGKTLVARAIASQCNLSFIAVQGPELLNSYVGQSEDNVRKIFDRARSVAPTVLFFDEIDAIAPRRSGGVIDRVLAQLLSEMDGIQASCRIFVIAATNRPELLDPAILRPGRLDKRVHVTVGKDVGSRVEVFKALSRNLRLDENVCFRTVCEMTGPLSGAECYGVLLEACYRAIERCVEKGTGQVVVNNNDLIATIHKGKL